jgi:parallel beta-helix repeat protein
VLSQSRQELGLGEVEETFLVGTHLMEIDVVVARIHELLDSLDMLLGIWAAEDALGYRVLIRPLACVLEVRVVGNSFRHNAGDAVHTVESNSNLIKANLMARNGGQGFVLEDGERNQISRNRLARNGAGIAVSPGRHTVISKNRVLGGRDGIRVETIWSRTTSSRTLTAWASASESSIRSSAVPITSSAETGSATAAWTGSWS